MSSITVNHVVLAGYLARDPESRTLRSGATVCHLRLALNSASQDQAGVWHEKPQFFNVVVYGKQGENAAKWLHKGDPVCVDGRLAWREWNPTEGTRAEAVKVVARSIEFLGRPPRDGANTETKASRERPWTPTPT